MTEKAPSLAALAREMASLASRWCGAPMGLLARRTSAGWQALAAWPSPDPELVERPELEALLEMTDDREGQVTGLRRLPFPEGAADGCVRLWRLAQGRWALAMFHPCDEDAAPLLATPLRESRALWGQMLTAAEAWERSQRDPETGLRRRAALLEVVGESPGGLLLIDWEAARRRPALERRAARLLRAGRPSGSQAYRMSRGTFALLLPEASQVEVRGLKARLSEAFAALDERPARFGLGLWEDEVAAAERLPRAVRALAEAIASDSSELVVRPSRYDKRRSRSSGRLRRGTGRIALRAPSARAFAWLRCDEDAGDALRVALHAAVEDGDPAEMLLSLLEVLALWLGFERGGLLRAGRDGGLRLEASWPEGAELEAPERLLVAAKASGLPQLHEEDERWLILPLKDGSADVALALTRGGDPTRLPIGLELLAALRPTIEDRLELARLRERRKRDKEELRSLRDELEVLETRGVVAEGARERPAPRAYPRLIGESAAMRRLHRILDRISGSDVPVLLQGETGTGKELVARSLHESGPRVDEPFVTVNCSAVSENLMESELFGHVRGAFTGANEDKQGYFEAAHGGTLFLDECQDMSPIMQRELLRVLQEGEVRRVGGKRTIQVDVRIIAAANRSLKELVSQDAFRQDLYYRLAVVNVDLPPLRQRLDDLPILVSHLVEALTQRYRLPTMRLDESALNRLAEHAWPGNVRELSNVLEKSLLLAEGTVIKGADLSFESVTEWTGPSLESAADVPYRDAKDRFAREYVTACLARHGGHVTRAAEAAGLGRSSFHKLMRKFDLNARDFHEE